MEKMIGFVPARGGSSRIPRKNIRKVGEIPLFLRACYNLNQVLPKEDIIVDSDDDEILSLAEEKGFGTLRRPGELATNATDGNAFFRWETSNYPDADIYIQHLPPMPFLSEGTIRKSLDAISQGYDSVVCIGKEHFYLWDMVSGKPLYDVKHIPNSFILKETVFETMGFYAITKQAHKDTGLRIGKKYKFIELHKFEQIDVNYQDDFELADAIARGLKPDSVYNLKIE